MVNTKGRSEPDGRSRAGLASGSNACSVRCPQRNSVEVIR